MNNEQQQIIDEAYENYLDITDRKWMNSDIGDLDDMIYDGYLFIDGDDIRVLKIEEFIYIIKEVAEFSERWGLKIEERELSLKEQAYAYNNLLEKQNYNPKWQSKIKDIDKLSEGELMTILQSLPGPTKLITITYNDKTIENYE
jgi:hypothetical protein